MVRNWCSRTVSTTTSDNNAPCVHPCTHLDTLFLFHGLDSLTDQTSLDILVSDKKREFLPGQNDPFLYFETFNYLEKLT